MATTASASTLPPGCSATPLAKRLDEMALARGWTPVLAAERLQAARLLRERLCCVPFYAKRAAQAAARGDEMAYWLDLQSSQATAHRR